MKKSKSSTPFVTNQDYQKINESNLQKLSFQFLTSTCVLVSDSCAFFDSDCWRKDELRVLVWGIAQFRVSDSSGNEEFCSMSHFHIPGVIFVQWLWTSWIFTQFRHQSHTLEVFPSLFRIFWSLLHSIDRINFMFLRYTLHWNGFEKFSPWTDSRENRLKR